MPAMRATAISVPSAWRGLCWSAHCARCRGTGQHPLVAGSPAIALLQKRGGAPAGAPPLLFPPGSRPAAMRAF